jgi:uridylate kinase
MKNPGAKRFESLGYDEALRLNLQVMDTAAFALCRDAELPLRIFDMSEPGVLLRILRGEDIGTLVQGRSAQ